MKRVLSLGVVIAMLTSCSGSSDNQGYLANAEYIPVYPVDGTNYDMLAPDGSLMSLEGFQAPSVTTVSEGVFSSVNSSDGSYSLYTIDKHGYNVVPDCEALNMVGTSAYGLIPVVKAGERISIIDKEGKKKLDLMPVDGKEIAISSPAFSDGLLRIKTSDNKVGYLNTSGECVISPTFSDGSDFCDGYAAVNIGDDTTSTWRIIDGNGKVHTTVKGGATVVSRYEHKRFLCIDENQKFFFIDKDGNETVLPEYVTSITGFNSEMFVYIAEDGSSGVTAMDGKNILDAKYRYITLMNNGDIAAVDNQNQTEIFSSDGENLRIMDGESIYLGKFGFLVGTYNTPARLYTENGEIRNAPALQFGEPIDNYGSLRSDYFDMDSFEQQLKEYVKFNAVGPYELRKACNLELKGVDLSKYTNTKRYTREGAISGTGFKGDITYFLNNNVAREMSGSYKAEPNLLEGAVITIYFEKQKDFNFLKMLTHELRTGEHFDASYVKPLVRTSYGTPIMYSIGIPLKTPTYRLYPTANILTITIGHTDDAYRNHYNNFVQNRPVVFPDWPDSIGFDQQSDFSPFAYFVSEAEYDEFIPDDYEFQ